MASFFFLNFSLERFKTDSIIKSLRKRSQILSNVKLGYNNKALLLTDAVTNADNPDDGTHTWPPEREHIKGSKVQSVRANKQRLPQAEMRLFHHTVLISNEGATTNTLEHELLKRVSFAENLKSPRKLHPHSSAAAEPFPGLSIHSSTKTFTWFLSLAITLISPTSTNLEKHFNFQSFH